MNKSPLSLLAAIGALAALNGCHDSPTEEVSTASDQRSGRLSLRVEAGTVGVLARAAAMNPSKLVLRFSSPNVPDVLDTLPLSTGNPVTHDYSLSGGRNWTVVATGFDGNDSILHQGSETFRVGSDSTTNVRMSLDARYSSLSFRFPVPESLTRIFVAVDGVVWCDTIPTHYGWRWDSVMVQRDYLAASRAGVPHALSLKASGNRGDKDTVLYALDTTLVVVSGQTRSHRLSLRWVGPGGAKGGMADLSVSLGAAGSISFAIDFADPPQACGAWKDQSGFPWNSAISYGTLCDSRDGKVYRTVEIGSQTWMAENLNYGGTSRFRLGYCEDGVDCQTYGRYYDWNESMAGEAGSVSSPSGVQGICPTGWHVPSLDEWLELRGFVDSSNTTASTKLRALSGWNGNAGTDQFGFRVLGGGYRVMSLPMIVARQEASMFWSASPADGYNILSMEFFASTPEITALGLGVGRGHHLRCVQD